MNAPGSNNACRDKVTSSGLPRFTLCRSFDIHKMVVGRLTHYGIDLVLISVILGGIKRSSGFGYAELTRCGRATDTTCNALPLCNIFRSGFLNVRLTCTIVSIYSLSPSALSIPEGTPRGIADGYLRFGESTFDYLSGMSYASAYFVREGRDHSK